MTLSEELLWRGFINQTTFADSTDLDKETRTFYHGFDASAPSQTVGNLAAMMFDRAFLRHGYKAILLAGGATSLIGDPGGKDAERTLQNEEAIAQNVRNAGEELQRIMRGHDFTLVNNLDWTKRMTVIEFLRDIGKHFSMTPLVQRDYIARRLGEGGSGISYTEFSYTLLQGMDFLHLFDNYGVTLQLGGADQWGNCLSGVDLVRRARGKEVHAVTLPLIINKATGKKFGKSEEGAVWLDPTLTTPTQFYQFWINADDDGVEGYLKIFTELDKPTVDSIIEQHTANPRERLAQTRLAQEVTKLVHGEAETAIAEAITACLTGKRSLEALDAATVTAMRHELSYATAQPGDEIVEALTASGLASSKTEARRFIKESAVSINHNKITRETFEASDFANGALLLRRGKAYKDTALIERAK